MQKIGSGKYAALGGAAILASVLVFQASFRREEVVMNSASCKAAIDTCEANYEAMIKTKESDVMATLSSTAKLVKEKRYEYIDAEHFYYLRRELVNLKENKQIFCDPNACITYSMYGESSFVVLSLISGIFLIGGAVKAAVKRFQGN